MNESEVVGVIAFVVTIAAAAFLAAAETAITRVSTARAEALVEEGRRGARTLRDLIDRREHVLPPILFMVLACQIGAATVMTVIVLEHWGTWQLICAFIAELLLLYAIAEALPKSWALAHPDRSATMAAPLVKVLSSIAPLRWVANGIVTRMGANIPNGISEGEVSEEELLALAEEAAASAAIDEEERVLIEQVIEFGDTVAHEVMVPRPDITAVSDSITIDEAASIVIEHGFSRVPVYGKNIDDIRGIIYSKDIMRSLRDGSSHNKVADVMREPFYVPEAKKISQLLREMQSETFHMAIVIDEYGGTAGLVTLEDLIEEVVGEIVDEFDVEPPMVERLSNGNFRVNGRADLDDLEAMLLIDLPAGDWNTVGGLIFNSLGHVPAVGETIEINHHRFYVERVQGRRIARVLISPSADTQR
ncbi:MAG: hemolysin family protein [Acidimicrobiales bacterium]|nr:hemolysin family protein [Acidimicrobiales bacterium]